MIRRIQLLILLIVAKPLSSLGQEKIELTCDRIWVYIKTDIPENPLIIPNLEDGWTLVGLEDAKTIFVFDFENYLMHHYTASSQPIGMISNTILSDSQNENLRSIKCEMPNGRLKQILISKINVKQYKVMTIESGLNEFEGYWWICMAVMKEKR